MNQQYNLIYPTVDLFVYDLQQGLGQTDEQIDRNRHHFWRKIKPELNKDYQKLNSQEQDLLKKLALLEKTEADYVELHEPEKHEYFQPDLEGYYRALQLSDTYALQVDCSVINDNNSKPISRLQDIKKNIESRIHQQGKLGQTWFVWGQLSKISNDEEIKAIAQQCYKQINPNSQSKINFKQGTFLGATAFDVWEQPNDWVDEKSFQNSFHILICLFPPQRSLDDITTSIANIYFDLNRLFCYRHKIIWAYHQSRKLKSKLKKDFHAVQQIVKKITELGQQINAGKLNLQELQKTLTDTLTILSHYAIDLSYLDDQGRTIKVNLNNYKKRLEKISRENSNNQRQFMQEFSEFSAEKYLQQIETDYINLSPGLTLLQNLISTIQGTIDIYQTKSDRHLEEFIGIAGVGLATSQIGSAVILAEIPKNQNPLTYQTEIFILSLGIGLIFAALTYILLRSLRR